MMKTRFTMSIDDIVTRFTLRAVSIALVFFAACVLVFQAWLFKRNIDDRLAVMSSILGANVTAALEFEDNQQAELVLSSLISEPDVVKATLYDRTGREVAMYQRTRLVTKQDSMWSFVGGWFDAQVRQFNRPVVLRNEQIGYIQLVASARQLYTNWLSVLLMIVIVAFLAGWLSLFNTSHLKRRITEPISDLADAMSKVIKDGDFTVRLHGSQSIREIEKLSDSFDFMLAGIQRRDQTVTQQNHQLLQNNRDLIDALDKASQARKTVDQLLTENNRRHSLLVNNMRVSLLRIVVALKDVNVSDNSSALSQLMRDLEGVLSVLDAASNSNSDAYH